MEMILREIKKDESVTVLATSWTSADKAYKNAMERMGLACRARIYVHFLSHFGRHKDTSTQLDNCRGQFVAYILPNDNG